MSTQPDPAVTAAADGLLAKFAGKFVDKESFDNLRKDLMAEILAAKKAPEFHAREKKWVVRSQITGERREMEYSLGRILYVLNARKNGTSVTEDRFAAEVDFVKRAISDGTAGSGGSLIPQEWVDFVIPELGARTVVLRAKPVILPMQHQILNLPSITANQTVNMVGENTAITETDPTTSTAALTLHTAKFLTGLSIEWLRDATPETDAALQASLVRSLARFVDGQMLNGAGGGTTCTGLSKVSVPAANSINSGGGQANGSAPTYDDFNAIIEALDEANAPQEGRCWFMRPKTIGEVRGLKDSLGRPLFYDNLQAGAFLLSTGAVTDLGGAPDGFVLGYPVYTTTNVPNNLTLGTNNNTSYILLVAMSDIYVGQGIRSQGMEIAISDQALFTSAEIAVRGLWRFDLQPGHTASIGIINGVI